MSVATSVATGQKVTWQGVVGGAIGGAVAGAIIGGVAFSGVGTAALATPVGRAALFGTAFAAGGAASTFTTGALTKLTDKNYTASWSDIGKATAISAGTGFATGAAFGLAGPGVIGGAIGFADNALGAGVLAATGLFAVGLGAGTVGNALSQYIVNGQVDWKAAVQAGVASGFMLAVMGAIGGYMGFKACPGSSVQGPGGPKPPTANQQPPVAKAPPKAPAIPVKPLSQLPQDVQTSFAKYDAAGWKGNVSGQTPGTRAGGAWDNGRGQLPTTDSAGKAISYKEFDVNSKTGPSRDWQRFVCGSDGSVYYTDSHYGDHASPTGLPDFVRVR